MQPEPRMDALVGTVLEGAYRITRLVGEGGMGAVYEAVQLRLNKRVAIKLMSRDLAANREALARFHREAEITSHLGHPTATVARRLARWSPATSARSPPLAPMAASTIFPVSASPSAVTVSWCLVNSATMELRTTWAATISVARIVALVPIAATAL